MINVRSRNCVTNFSMRWKIVEKLILIKLNHTDSTSISVNTPNHRLLFGSNDSEKSTDAYMTLFRLPFYRFVFCCCNTLYRFIEHTQRTFLFPLSFVTRSSCHSYSMSTLFSLICFSTSNVFLSSIFVHFMFSHGMWAINRK